MPELPPKGRGEVVSEQSVTIKVRDLQPGEVGINRKYAMELPNEWLAAMAHRWVNGLVAEGEDITLAWVNLDVTLTALIVPGKKTDDAVR
jgi:hypothetical protein